MDVIALNELNLVDYPEVQNELKNVKNVNEAWRILNEFAFSLDKVMAELERNVDPQQILDELHRYNDMKDIAQVAIGTLANLQGLTIAKVHEQYNLIVD